MLAPGEAEGRKLLEQNLIEQCTRFGRGDFRYTTMLSKKMFWLKHIRAPGWGPKVARVECDWKIFVLPARRF